MKNRRIEIRVCESEYSQLKAKAENSDITISDLIRNSALSAKTWSVKDKALESERIRQIAKIGNNLNQIARFCNTYKSAADTFEICQYLVSIENELEKAFK